MQSLWPLHAFVACTQNFEGCPNFATFACRGESAALEELLRMRSSGSGS